MKSHTSSKIRITSGIYRSREISVPIVAHAMGSRERLALFNSISDYLPGATVLDCFAGSGSLGIEAISRGAKSVTFVEKDPKAAATIKVNLKSLGISATVVKADTGNYRPSQIYNLILADPPYDDFQTSALAHLFDFLSPDGHLVLSHPSSFMPNLPGLKLISTKKYANCHISIFTK